MVEYNETCELTGWPVAREQFKVLAMRGDDIKDRAACPESYCYHVLEGEKIREVLQLTEEDGFIDKINDDCKIGDIDNQPPEPGQFKHVTGDVVWTDCGDLIRFENVKWGDV